LDAAVATNASQHCNADWACVEYAGSTQDWYRLPQCELSVTSDGWQSYLPLDSKAIWSKDYMHGLALDTSPGVTLTARFRQNWHLAGWANKAVVPMALPFALVAPVSTAYNVSVTYEPTNTTTATHRRLTSDNPLKFGAPWDDTFRAWATMTSWGTLELHLSQRTGGSERILTAADVGTANMLSLPACPPGSWSTLAVSLRRDGGAGAASVAVSCDATSTRSRAEVPLVEGFWNALPPRAFVVLGASGRGWGPAGDRAGWFDHPSDTSEFLSASLAEVKGDLAGFALYSPALSGAGLEAALRRIGVAERPAAQEHSCPCSSGSPADGAPGGARYKCCGCMTARGGPVPRGRGLLVYVTPLMLRTHDMAMPVSLLWWEIPGGFC
jgi:hypothetical protein